MSSVSLVRTCVLDPLEEQLRDIRRRNGECSVRSTNRKSIVGSPSATYKASIRDRGLLGRQWSPLSTTKPFSLRGPDLPYIYSTQRYKKREESNCGTAYPILPEYSTANMHNVSTSERIQATVSESVEANASCSSANNYISSTVVTCLAEPSRARERGAIAYETPPSFFNQDPPAHHVPC